MNTSMKSAMLGVLAALATILPGWAGEHRDKEKADTIALDAVPACVSKAAAQYLATADTKEAKKIVEEGIVKYEVMGGKDKEDVEVTLTANGEVLKVTRNMDTEKLPVAMVAAIQKDYPGVKLRKVESVQRFYYEVDAVVDSKHREFKAMASGDIEDRHDHDKGTMDKHGDKTKVESDNDEGEGEDNGEEEEDDKD